MTPPQPGPDPDAGPGQPDPEPSARVRARSTLSWVWVAPAFSAAVVLWLVWHTFSQRGPAITIEFASAEGLTAGETEIRHKGVHVGTVESLGLTSGMSAVIVHARMAREAAAHLNEHTRFWIVSPRVGASGISGLNTLVSGAYIEMYPGDGAPRRQFVGLPEPPVLQPDTPGRSFTLTAAELGAIGVGTPLTYRGLSVGQIEGYQLAPDAGRIDIFAFVRVPYDRLVHADTRFWDASAIDVSAGASGIRVRLNSLQQLVTGAVAFDTPGTGAPQPASAAGTVFALYESQATALAHHGGPRLGYTARFFQDASLEAGTPVELRGTDVGEVTAAHLAYDPDTHELFQAARFEIDPSAITLTGGPSAPVAQAAAVQQALARLVDHGLRAQLITASLLTGQKVIALGLVRDAPRAQIQVLGAERRFPTAPAADVDAILKSLQDTLDHVDRLTAGPQLTDALDNLDRTLVNLERLTHDLQPQIQPLIASLRATADAAQNAARSASAVLGSADLPQQLPQLLQQVSLAARSIRELADYLERHPEALLRGRSEDPR